MIIRLGESPPWHGDRAVTVPARRPSDRNCGGPGPLRRAQADVLAPEARIAQLIYVCHPKDHQSYNHVGCQPGSVTVTASQVGRMTGPLHWQGRSPAPQYRTMPGRAVRRLPPAMVPSAA